MSELCLGIESTAHTFGVGIVDSDGKILANEKSTFIPAIGKGMVPREAADHHVENSCLVLESALEKAHVGLKDISLVSVAAGAGLPPCLTVGVTLARFLASRNSIPLVPVCHQVAHIEIGKLTTKAKDPVVLYLSGGNTQVIAFAEGRYRIFGETMNIPVGNSFDVLARAMGLPTPGGPEIERLARGGKYLELPYTVKGMDLSFTGITTAARKKFESGSAKEDISYSFQETVFSMLAEVTERAMAHTGKNEALLVGGVAANRRLQEMISVMADERGAETFVVPFEYSGDNGAMISWNGILMKRRGGKFEIKNTKVRQRWRTDEVEITWI